MILEPKDFKNMLALPLLLVTTRDKEGIGNAAPYGCMMPMLKDLDLLAITSAPERQTLQNIRDTKEFILNIASLELAKQVMFCAQPFPPEVNEITAAGLTEAKAAKVSVPRVAECLGWIECVLEEELARDNYVISIGRVVHAEIKDGLEQFHPLYGFNGKMVTPK